LHAARFEKQLFPMNSKLSSSGKLLFFIPIPGINLTGYWHRDQGLLVDEARRQGYEAFLVCPPPAPQIADARMIVASHDDLSRSEWWVSQKPWAVVCNTWGASRFRHVWNAALQATPRLLERLDTDGIRSPRVEPRLFFYQFWSRLHDAHGPRLGPWLAPPVAAAQGAMQLLLPGLVDRKICQGLATLPVVTAESPLAAERIRRLLKAFGFPGSNVEVLPHPVHVENDSVPGPAEKRNLVVSVGRWNSHQKNFTLLYATLAHFLAENDAWSAAICGVPPANPPPNHRRNRIMVEGVLDHRSVIDLLRKAKVFLMSSRHESFGIAAAEALCQGCSVVGPGHIPSVQWFASNESGTVAKHYNAASLLRALAAESEAWDGNLRRNPQLIGERWREQLSAPHVFRRLMALLEGIELSR
jgi:glycosyltransferase involved in cell wall biosynthesis